MNKIQVWLKIRKLQKVKSEIYNEYKNKRVGKKGEELQLISHEYSAEADLIDDEIWELHQFCPVRKKRALTAYCHMVYS